MAARPMPVETLISERPLHGSVQAGFLHTAPTLGVLRQTRCRDRQAQTAAQGRENLSEDSGQQVGRDSAGANRRRHIG